MNGLPRLLQLGDHLCQFFATADELGEVLVPYFKEGLERNEACIWITSDSYDKERALSDMRSAAHSFEKRYAAGQLQIFASRRVVSGERPAQDRRSRRQVAPRKG